MAPPRRGRRVGVSSPKRRPLSPRVSNSSDTSPTPSPEKRPPPRRRRLDRESDVSTHQDIETNEPENVIPVTEVEQFETQREIIPAKNVQAIYATCLDLFQSNKIKVENSFNCKLIDCLDQLIESPEFDITNMQLVGRTLEVGSRIYVCRVDFTYGMVMGLAQRIGAKGKALERLREIAEQQRRLDEAAEDAEEEEFEAGPNELDENGELMTLKVRKPRKMKRIKSSHAAPKEKIRLHFGTDKVDQFKTRQARLKELLTNFKANRKPIPREEFEIKGRIKVVPIEVSLAVAEKQLETLHKFPLALFKPYVERAITFLPFIWLPRGVPFDRDVYDPWGRPRHGPGSVEDEKRKEMEARHQALAMEKAAQVSKLAEEYAFDGNEGLNMDMGGDSVGHGGDEVDSDEGRDAVQPKITDLGQVKDMIQLAEFYQSLRTMGHVKKNAFGWAGPNFLKGRGAASRPGTATSVSKRPWQKKIIKPLTFNGIDWKSEENRYHASYPGKSEVDDRMLERWKKTQFTIPFKPTPSEEFDENAFEEAYMETIQGDDNVDPILRYFIDRRRNILQLFKPPDNCQKNKDRGDGIFDADFPYDDEQDDVECVRTRLDGEGFQDNEFGNELPRDTDQENVPPSGNRILDTFLSFFSTFNPSEIEDYEDYMGSTVDSEGVKFAKQPKPVNMRLLKRNIIQTLKERLHLNEELASTEKSDMKIDLLLLVAEVFRRVDDRTAKFLSLSLLFIALLHVVVELKLFLEAGSGELETVFIIARAKGWEHGLHIPLPNNNGMNYFIQDQPLQSQVVENVDETEPLTNPVSN